MRTVADQFADTLVAAGVKRIYGMVDDSLNGITDAIRRQGKIAWMHVRHEEVTACRRRGTPDRRPRNPAAAWRQSHGTPHIFGLLPGRHERATRPDIASEPQAHT